MLSSISFHDSVLDSLDGFEIKVEGIEVSPIKIKDVKLENFSSDFSYASGVLSNPRIKIDAQISLNGTIRQYCIGGWGVEVCTPGGSFSRSLGTISSGFQDIPNISLNAGNVKINVPNLTLSFQSGRIKIPDETLGHTPISTDQVKIDSVNVKKTSIPVSSPFSNLSNTSIPIPLGSRSQDFSSEDASVDKISIPNITIPPFKFSDMIIRDVFLEKVELGGFSGSGNSVINSPTINILGGFVRLWITVRVTTTLTTEKTEIKDLSGWAQIKHTNIGGLEMDVNIKNIDIGSMEFDNYANNKMQVNL